jgi:hypothetical protein
MIQRAIPLNAGRLKDALELTFAARDSHTLPPVLPTPPDNWEGNYGTLAREVGLSTDPLDGHQLAADFLDPVLATRVADESIWNPHARRWE